MKVNDFLSMSNIDYVLQDKNNQATINMQYTKPVIGIDRDGIINYLSDSPIRSQEQFIPIEGSLEAIALMRSKGYQIVIIFDQPDISKGLMTQYDVDQMNNYLFQLLGMAGCPSIDGLYYCTSSDKRDIYAKPNDGMFKRAESELGLSFRKGGYYVGDSIEDLESAEKVKATPVLIGTGNYQHTLERLNKFPKKELKRKVKFYNSLYEFAESLE